MSFGPSSSEKTAQNNISGASNAAQNQLFPAAFSEGQSALNNGQGNIESGTNFFNTLLNGNQANTTALLQPNIDQIRNSTQANLNAASTLMPRGGGRGGALFADTLAPQSQIQNLFNGVRSNAASILPQIGIQQQQLGANLFNVGNNALGTSITGNTENQNAAFQDRQLSNQMAQGIGQAAFGLLTTPFGGGAAANGLLGLLPGGGK